MVEIEVIPASALGGIGDGETLAGQRARFKVGDLVYEGYGVTIRCSDPRFAEIGTDGILKHHCGYQVDAPSGWNAYDDNLQRQTITFRRRPEPDANSLALARRIEKQRDVLTAGAPKPEMRARISAGSVSWAPPFTRRIWQRQWGERLIG